MCYCTSTDIPLQVYGYNTSKILKKKEKEKENVIVLQLCNNYAWFDKPTEQMKDYSGHYLFFKVLKHEFQHYTTYVQ